VEGNFSCSIKGTITEFSWKNYGKLRRISYNSLCSGPGLKKTLHRHKTESITVSATVLGSLWHYRHFAYVRFPDILRCVTVWLLASQIMLSSVWIDHKKFRCICQSARVKTPDYTKGKCLLNIQRNASYVRRHLVVQFVWRSVPSVT
jgi:hypothetical protein